MIVVDASCRKNPGPFEYRGMDMTQDGKIIFEYSYKYGTNNIGEFLAVVHALKYCKDNGITSDIYTDSNTALAWVRDGKVNTSVPDHADPQINATVKVMLARAEKFLKTERPANKVLKWDTVANSDIPADYGRKPKKKK